MRPEALTVDGEPEGRWPKRTKRNEVAEITA
jgi:hypothetical protein